MTEFTPLASATGGLLIGLSAVILMALAGKIAGVSGIVARLLPPTSNDTGWRLAFVAGLLAAPLLARIASGAPVPQTVSDSLPLMIAAGLLVGFGAVVGNGCTSGHGVCGLSRLSRRSLVATLTFMASAAVTVFLARHGV